MDLIANTHGLAQDCGNYIVCNFSFFISICSSILYLNLTLLLPFFFPQIFTREDVADSGSEGSSNQQVVRVTNNKLGMSTFWSLDKLESRMVQMREMYQVGWTNRVNSYDSKGIVLSSLPSANLTAVEFQWRQQARGPSQYKDVALPVQCKPDISRSCVSRNWIYRGRMLDPIFLAAKSAIFFAKSR